MKGILVAFFGLVILLAGAGAVFYAGWVQIHIEENMYGVIFSKTHGYENETVDPGTFVWRPERIIPGNFSMHLFPITARTVNLSISGNLPSGDLYSHFLEGTPDFSYRTEYRISYRVSPTSLPGLVKEKNITPDTLAEFYQLTENGILSEAEDVLIRFFSSTEIGEISSTLRTEINTRVLNALSKGFPELEFISVNATTLDFPDTELYLLGRETYFGLMEVKKEQIAETLRASAGRETELSVKIDILQQYGALFTEYPVLLDYLALFPDSTGDLVPGLNFFRDTAE